MAAPAPHRARRGPAPIASFDHDVSDESSPESKQPARLAEIREATLAPPAEGRARSHSSPGLGLGAAAAPRIDISRASSSSHHDSRDSSPELALFAGTAEPHGASLGFREDGTAELRSSTEELAFLEPAPPPQPPPAAPASRRHSRKDSQGSEAALLAISGRTSRLSSIGSQCSAQSAVSHTSRVSRLSVVSGVSRSPSPHKMLLETSFCGPKPIETDPEICAAAVEERLLEIAKLQARPAPPAAAPAPADPPAPAPVPAPVPVSPPAPSADARDRREVRTEVRLEAAPRGPAAGPGPAPAVPDKRDKETRNREQRRARSRERRDPTQPEVYSTRNRSKDVIRIKLKPDEEYDDDDDNEEEESDRTAAGGGAARKPETLALTAPGARSPSPAPAPPSRKSSFCSLFKSRETIASPDSPSDALRRKKSLTEGRSRSKSRDRSAPPAAACKLRGSVLSLFKTPRRSVASASPGSRAASPGPAPPSVPPPPQLRGLKYYEDSRDGIIHIPLRTPPDDAPPAAEREPARPASAPCARSTPAPPTQRTVLPDGSIIIPLHSPTEREAPASCRQAAAAAVETSPPTTVERAEPRPEPRPEPQSRSTSRSGSRGEAGPSPRPEPPASAGRPEPEPPPVVRNERASPETPATPATPASVGSPPERPPEVSRSRRKERLVFTTHVGSTEQVFSTQFSITKTPSVTSEISESFPSLQEEPRALRDTHIAAECASGGGSSPGAGGGSPAGATRDSSESEGSSDAGAAARGAGDVEARGLVVQESFEEELPYVPTTLPQERSLALPMLPVRERGPQLQTTASVSRPRSAARGAGGARMPPPPAPPQGPPAPPQERLRIRLPRRASAHSPAAQPAISADRSRTRSGGDGAVASEPRKSEWIDFTEVPERRKAARRIQTLPARAGAAADGAAGDVEAEEDGVSYVEPEHCRCECHRAASPALPEPHDDRAARPLAAELEEREDAHS